jgi:alkylated DNA nucleotide flippase Atl1
MTSGRDQNGPPAAGDPETLDDYSSDVLDVVDAIPPGRVMAYGEIAGYLGRGGPRQVGRVMSTCGGAVPWWRVVHADGSPAPGHDRAALTHYRAEDTPLRFAPDGRAYRVSMARARWRPPPA